MADRVSTIRFRVVGVQGASTALQQLSREVQAKQFLLTSAQEKYMQAQRGGDQVAVDKAADGVMVAQKRMTRILADVDYAATHDKYAVQQRMLDRSLEEGLARVDGNEKAKAALQVLHAKATAEVTAKANAPAEKAAEKQRAISQKRDVEAYNAKGKAAADAAKVEQQAADDKDKADFKYWSDSRKAAEERDKAEFKYWSDTRKAAENRVKQDNELAARRIRIEADSADEIARLRSGIGGKPSRDRSGGGGGASDVEKAAANFGGKMILTHAAGQMAGSALGNEMGGVVQAGIGGYMFGGPQTAAAAAAIAAAGAGMELFTQHLLRARDLQIEWSNTVRQTAYWYENLTANANTGTGTTLTKRAQELRQQAVDVRNAEDKRQTTFTGFYTDLLFGRNTKPDEMSKSLDDQATKMQQIAVAQQQVAKQREIETAGVQLQAEAINGMYDGPAKRQASMSQQNAEDARKARIAHEDRLAAIEAMPAGNAKVSARGDEDRKYARIQQEQADMARQRGVTEQRKADTEQRQDREAADAAGIRASNLGFQRELELMRQKHQVERDEYDRAGRDKTNLLRRQASDEALLYVERNKAVGDMSQDMDYAAQASTHSIRKMDAEWAQQSRHLQRDLGISGQALQTMQDKFYTMAKAALHQPLIDQMYQLGLNTQYARREIQELDLTRNRLARQNPDADPAVIEKLAQAQNTLRIAQFSEQETMRLRPGREYARYERYVKEGTDSGEISAQEANNLLTAKSRELSGAQMGGMTDVSSYLHDIQTKALTQTNLPQQTVDELRSLRSTFERLVAEGIRLRH